jgi:MarR family transcriptional regulator, transcriptional regulator for hemolysin
VDVGAEFAVALGRVSRRWRVRLDERFRHTGLTQARWTVLLQLSQAGAMSQRELAERIGVEGPTLVRALDKLEDQGFVARRAGDDRRVKEIHLTDAAAPVLAEITRISTELRRALLADVPARDVATAWRVLKAVSDQLDML